MIGGLGSLGAPEDERRSCSRAGCGEDARWNINWRNPRIHGIDRVKVWRACDEHRDYLRDYLDTRGFPVEVTTLGVVPVSVGSEADGPGDAR